MSGEPVKQAIASQLKNLEVNSGKSLEEWTKIINTSGLTKHGELVSMLKEKFGIGHGNANMLVHHAKQSHAAAIDDDDQLIAEQYKGKEDLKTWYDRVMSFVLKFGNDVDISPKKAYVSLRRKKQFALIQPSTKTRLDIGLNAKNLAANDRVASASSWNTMCTHRIKIEQESDIDDDVIISLKKAYDEAG